VVPRIREALEDVEQLSLDKPVREALGKQQPLGGRAAFFGPSLYVGLYIGIPTLLSFFVVLDYSLFAS
jgi:hypothetical protein